MQDIPQHGENTLSYGVALLACGLLCLGPPHARVSADVRVQAVMCRKDRVRRKEERKKESTYI